MTEFWPTFARLQNEGTPFCVVTLVDFVGSAPADRGAKMLVTHAGIVAGTIGGGKVEARALLEAGQLLASGGREPIFASWNLQTDLGMTCGGVVRLFFELHQTGSWPIAVFGAGHVAQSLVRVLLPLPCALSCFDTRLEWLDRLPDDARLCRVQSPDLAGEIAGLPPRSFLVLMTMGHATDLPVLREALKRPFPFVGVIGSKAKSAALRRTLSYDGFSLEQIARVVCPVGLPIGTNHLQEIAISIAVQLIQVRDVRTP